MMHGRIARIRVNSKDCMAIVDLLEKIGMQVKGMSFSQGVSIALSSTMESLRQQGVLPVRDGFEYNNLMKRFPPDVKAARARALDITRTMNKAGPDAQVPAVMPSRKVAQAEQRLGELTLKMEADPLNVSEQDQLEASQLRAFLRGEPEPVQ